MDETSGAGPRRARARQSLAFYAVAAAAGILASALCFGEFFTSRGNLISGNFGDPRLNIVLQEHWYNVFRGREDWLSPLFFHPVAHVLSYSVTLALQSLPYSVLRLAGCDPYVSFELTLWLFAMIGYAATLALLRFFGVNRWFAVLGAVLFSCSNLYHLCPSSQCYTTMLVPALLLCVAKAVGGGASPSSAPVRTTVLLSLAGAAWSLILYSEFYTGWFFTLFAAIACLIIVVVHRSLARSGLELLVRSWPSFAIALLVAALAMVPFALTYGPAIAAHQGRPFDEVIRYSLTFSDLVNISRANLVWGRLLERLDPRSLAWGQSYGLPPGLVLTFMAACGWLLARELRRGRERDDPRFALLSSAAAAVLVAWALMCRTDHGTLWHAVWHRVPGASAIRVTARFQYLLSLVVVAASVAALSAAWEAAGPRRRGAGGWVRVLLAAAGAFLAIEEVNLARNHGIDRRQELALLATVPGPPPGCESFCLREPPEPAKHGIAQQIDAMLIAERLGVPTVNGYSGFNPPGWNMANTASADYYDQVGRWAALHHLRHLCAVLLAERRWVEDPLTPLTPLNTARGADLPPTSRPR